MKNNKERCVRKSKIHKHKIVGSEDKKKEPRHNAFIFIGTCLVAMLFVGMGVVSATVTYDGTKIVISDEAETITAISQTLNDPSLLEQTAAKEWLLKKPLIIESTGILIITDVDCEWIKLQSLNDGDPAYIKNFGVLDMRSTRVTSWNSNTNDVAPTSDSTRAYIHSGGTKLLADSCDLSSLGSTRNPSSGVTYNGLQLSGSGGGSEIKNTTMTNNYIGLAIDENNVDIIDCEISYSEDYGIMLGWLNHPISNLYFDGVITHDNKDCNFECQYCKGPDEFSVVDSTFINCVSYNGKGNLFDFRSTGNLLIKNCTCHHSGFYDDWHSGFDFHTECNNLIVEDCEASECECAFFLHNGDTNCVIKNCVAHDCNLGFGINTGCTNNKIQDCRAYDAGDGFNIDGSSENEIINCTAHGCRYGVLLRPYDWSWTIIGYRDAYHCYDNVMTGCKFTSNSRENYCFEQSGEESFDYWGTNYIYDTVGSPVTIRRATGGHPNVLYKFESGRVFKVSDALGEEWIPCYPDGSYKQWTPADPHTTITAYNLYAPSIQVNIVINKFDTALPQGEILVEFNADTTDGNNVVLTAGGLKASYNYLVKRDGSAYAIKLADSSGNIQFSNLEWSTGHTFTIEETSTAPGAGTISGKVTDKDTGSDIESATVTVEGTGKSSETNITGNYTITEVPVGIHTVSVSAPDYEDATEPNVTVNEGETTTLDFQLTAPAMNEPPYRPSDPSPSDGATEVTLDETLSWTGGDPDAGDTVTYDVYFGTTTTPPLVAENQTGTTYDPGMLDYSAEYYWQVMATDNHGASNESEVWSFVIASGSDLAAEWHLDEGSGPTAVDTSGNGNNGTLVNNPAWVTGKIGNALEFDGTDDYIDCGQGSSLKITGAITVEAWVNWTGAGNPYLVTKTGGPGHRSYDLSGNTDGTVEFRIGGSDCNTIKSSGTISIPTGEWVHLAGTYEPSSYVRLFVNGALARENNVSIPASQGDNGLPWYIGAIEGKGGWFKGTIDEVKIYNRALSAEEIRAHYDGGSTNQPPVADPNNPYIGMEGVPLHFKGNGSYDPDGSVVAYEWTFGDGNNATEVNPTHTYAQNGTYTVTLTVADNEGATNTSTTTADIESDLIPPYTTGHSPAKDAIEVAKNTTIVVHVKDDGAGVDITSIVMRVNGITVTPIITGTPADYTLTYVPSTDFECGQIVDVTVDAHDLATAP